MGACSGSGLADDKGLLGYVEALIRFHLYEEPILTAIPTLDCRDPDARERALADPGDYVFKHRAGSGGWEVVMGPGARADRLRRLQAAVRASPATWVAQELVRFSTHPTVVDGALAPRHVDLRPVCVRTGDGYRGQLLAGRRRQGCLDCRRNSGARASPGTRAKPETPHRGLRAAGGRHAGWPDGGPR